MHTHTDTEWLHVCVRKTDNITGPFFGTRQSELGGWRWSRGQRGEKTRRRVNSGGGLRERRRGREGGREKGKEEGLSAGMNSLRLCGARFPRPPPGPFDK